MKFKPTKILYVVVVAAFLASGLCLAFSPDPVAAAGLAEDLQPPAQDSSLPDPVRLEQLYQRELKLLEGQAQRLERMEERSVGYQEKIDEFVAEGRDVTALEKALDKFNSRLKEVRDLHGEAGQILATHAGFDQDGKVTDARQAAETLKDAGKLMRRVHRELDLMPRWLAKALREFLRDNR